MYEQVEKPKVNKSRAVANSVTQKKNSVKQGFSFVDNRPEAVVQRKLQEMANNNPRANESPELNKATYHTPIPIIQNVAYSKKKKDPFTDLVTTVKMNDEQKFKQKFRAMDDGKDELISCEATFKRARDYFLAGNNSAMLDILKTSHGLRLDTGYVAHNVRTGGAGKKKSMGFHPTGQNDNLLKGPKNAKGNRRWVGHTRWNRRRAKLAMSEPKKQAMIDRAIEETLNRMSQPPFASNSDVVINNQARKDDWHLKREQLKRRHSKYDSSKKQKKNAKWIPGDRDRGVSPDR
jgi:hypothetical protein